MNSGKTNLKGHRGHALYQLFAPLTDFLEEPLLLLNLKLLVHSCDNPLMKLYDSLLGATGRSRARKNTCPLHAVAVSE